MSYSQTANPYSNYMAPAFVGMKADSMDDNVDTFAAGGVVAVGVAVKRTGANSMQVTPGADVALCVGVSLHDHIIAYSRNSPSNNAGYLNQSAVSVLTRGRAWVAVSDGTGVQDGVAAKADAVTGKFNTTGVAVTNAVFRSNAVQLLNGDWITYTLAAIVELHNPNV